MGRSGVKKLDLALLLVLAGLALAQFVLFFPNNHVVSDIWDYWRFQESGISLLFQPTVRPIGHALFWAAWTLSPNSWDLLNLTQVAVMILKAGAAYWFVTQLLNRPAGLLAGALILVIPAAFGVYSMWTVNVNLFLAALIVALASLVWVSRSFTWGGAALMVGALAFSLLSYDMGWPLALVGPAVLLVSLPNRSWRKALLLWYGTILVVIFSLAAVLLFGRAAAAQAETGVHFARQATVVDLSLESLPASIGSFFNAYRIHLLGVFEESLAFLPRSLRSPLVQIALLCGLTVGVALLALTWRGAGRLRGKQWVGAALIGLLYIGLGYGPITITLLRTDRFHEFIYSSFGAALFFAAVVCGLHNLVAQRGAVAARVASLALAAVGGLMMALFTFRSLDLTLALITTANQQKQFMETIVRQLPDPQPGAALFVYDADRRLFNLFEGRPDRVGYALGTVYEDHDLVVFICREPDDPPGYTVTCDQRPDTMVVRAGPGEPEQVFPLDQTAILQTALTDDGGARAEVVSLGSAVVGSDVLPRRIGMLETTPLPRRN